VEFSELIKVFSGVFVSDFLRYFIAAGFAYLLFWVLLKNVLSHKFIQRKFPDKERLFFEFKYSVSTAAIFACVGTGMFFLIKGGHSQMYHDIDLRGWWYFFLSIPLSIIIHDAYFYWTHRLMHHPKIFKYVHLVHHRSTNPSPWAAYSFHPSEAVVQAGIGPVLILMLPMHDLALLSFITYMITLNVFGHYGFEIFPKGFTRNKLVFWHNTSTHHNMHHKYFDYNYSLYFNWWDRIFKTLHPKYDDVFDEVASRKRTITGGIEKDTEDSNSSLSPT